MSDASGSRSQDAVQQALSLGGSTEKITEYYADWASAYDADLVAERYRAPQVMGELVTELSATHPRILLARTAALDAGCGTGLVGAELARLGIKETDGFDLSDAMVAEARKTGAYRCLAGGIDMNGGLTQYPADAYDLVVSCGVFTLGHVPPQALTGLLRVTEPGGLVLVSVRARYAAESGFEEYVDGLADEGRLRTVTCRRAEAYTADDSADYWAFEVRR